MQSLEDLQAVSGGREVRVTNGRKSGAWYRNRCRAVGESTWRVKYMEGGSRVGGGGDDVVGKEPRWSRPSMN